MTILIWDRVQRILLSGRTFAATFSKYRYLKSSLEILEVYFSHNVLLHAKMKMVCKQRVQGWMQNFHFISPVTVDMEYIKKYHEITLRYKTKRIHRSAWCHNFLVVKY